MTTSASVVIELLVDTCTGFINSAYNVEIFTGISLLTICLGWITIHYAADFIEWIKGVAD